MGKINASTYIGSSPMAAPLTIIIDLTAAETDLDAEVLESRSLLLVDELQSGDLVATARLARETDLPAGAKSGTLAFIGGILTAEINRENLKKAMAFLGNRFYGKTLTLEYKGDGLETKLEYRNSEELEQALAAVKTLEDIRIQVKG